MNDTLTVVGMTVFLVVAVLLNGAILWDLRCWCKAEHSDGRVSGPRPAEETRGNGDLTEDT